MTARFSRHVLGPALLFAALIFLAATPEALARDTRPDARPNTRPGAWAQPVELKDSENFFRITPDLYRSAQPNKKGMRAYEAAGIRTVINLRARHSDNDKARGTNLVLVHIPTRTRAVSSDEFIVKALQTMRDAEKPALVHCMHGADRTGLVIAAYRVIEQGWTREAALDELKNGGFGFHSIWTHIPEYLENLDEKRIEAIRNALR